jgi:hypothetical protein
MVNLKSKSGVVTRMTLRGLGENILLIEGIHDLFAGRQPIEELWQKWQQPEIWRLPHGHMSALLVLGLMGRILCWLSPRITT